MTDQYSLLAHTGVCLAAMVMELTDVVDNIGMVDLKAGYKIGGDPTTSLGTGINEPGNELLHITAPYMLKKAFNELSTLLFIVSGKTSSESVRDWVAKERGVIQLFGEGAYLATSGYSSLLSEENEGCGLGLVYLPASTHRVQASMRFAYFHPSECKVQQRGTPTARSSPTSRCSRCACSWARRPAYRGANQSYCRAGGCAPRRQHNKRRMR